MRTKKYFGILTAICFSLCLAGCGEAFPELTDDEYNQTVEFAVGLLMKYSNNGQAKLTYVDAKEVTKQREKEAALAEKEKDKETSKPAPQPVQEPVKVPEPIQTEIEEPSMSSTEDLSLDDQGSTQIIDSAIDASSEEVVKEPDDTTTETESVTDDPDAIVISTEETQEIIDDIFLAYEGYSVSSTYPESSKSYVINADKGKKLLVLRFDLYNGSNGAKKVNILEKNIKFQVILNGKNLGYTPVTFLPNDLSSYVGTIESRAHESLVVLTEIDQDMAKEIQSLGMIVSINGAEQKVSLK
ncbi:hypothetical protein bpr_I1236 [Butyrivibrio proteoclasticus B316]|uniref:DUF5067 domain-containing protein n=1 Tax=Butyrivibrio proteoclasticus (strain ATCC 51982 / DSM 14932 / B316) TaxID=515622 RepID=E0S2K8_BUTPB|nr:hypothetical protein [Butyrivibrio proteoclasticus]ADL33975.1 hypothetical protein bpr_I1236 [Butyrivibrio proteoclasticus B316]